MDAAGKHIKTREGGLPALWEARFDSARWIGIGATFKNEAFWRNATPHPYHREDKHSTLSRLLPSWYDASQPWLAYIPDGSVEFPAVAGAQVPWLFAGDLADARDLVDYSSDPPQLNAGVLRQMWKDYDRLGAAFARIGQVASVPSWDGTGCLAFATAMGSVEDVLTGTRLAQNRFLEGLGQLRYVRAKAEREGFELPVPFLEPDAPEDWYFEGRAVGCLVDPSSIGYSNIPLAQLAGDDVPIHYYWGRLTAIAQPLARGLQLGVRSPSPTCSDRSTTEERDPTCYLVREPDGKPELIAFRGASVHTKEALSIYAYEEGYSDDGWPTRTYYAQIPSRSRISSAAHTFDLDPELRELVDPSWALTLNGGSSIQISVPDVVVKHGVWVLEPLSELKLRVAARARNLRDPSEVLNYALQRGITFRVEVKTSVLSGGRIGEAIPEAPVWLTPGYRDVELPYLPSIRDMRSQYEACVDSLLRRTHAYAFLFQGGLLWRLAVHYSRGEILTWPRLGLSDSAIMYGHGKSSRVGYLGDLVAEHEMDVLLGVSVARDQRGRETRYLWWPRPEWLQARPHYRGEWTERDEKWFLGRLDDIRQQTARGVPKTAYQWQEMLGRVREKTNDVAKKTAIPDSERLRALLENLRNTSGTSWDGNTLSGSMSF
ncbi:hypothetical protein EIP86_008919 [Pleurotus ostreatoroseus]|nr:hypothetical protein EIP86_008919 [Pleurotus ostreatoroseus]